ncbi:MAG: glycoside hydrolase family 99-like domain-containing protein [Planctomycetaceae bacterium]|jgi:hypothetical protein|nr:glycoside hydrolase family 99-like domain-containing protein [Planctomycetaceae bacterium]
MKYHVFTAVILSLTILTLRADDNDSLKPPSIRQNSFQTDCPIIRAERPFTLKAVIENESKSPFECRLTFSPNMKTIGQKKTTTIDTTEFASTVTIPLICYQTGQVEFTLELLHDNKVVQRSTISQVVLPPRKIEKLESIPAPQPVKTDMLIGAHNCPLWEKERADLWNQVVKKHQERTPALGIYSQDNPEVSDWETKWAIEHGVSFFIYCWYRTSQAAPVTTMFEQSVFDDALFKSRFGSQMKFTIMWENQRRGVAGIADEKDLLENLMPYWIEKFFKRDNYLKIDNKPVLFVYRPTDVSLDLGGDDKAKAAFDLMREACKKAGFDGLYLLGEYRGVDPAFLTRFKNMGLDYTFAYCWYVPNSPPPSVAIDHQMEYIRKTQEMHDIIPQVVTLSQAWSGWKDEGTIWKLPPKDYEKLLRQGKEFVKNSIPKEELGSKMMILDNWNEWSEGHYIAPYREHGFGYLDAVRRVFSNAPEEHTDLIPEDIGLGPYSLPMALFENRTSWTYGGGDYENWKRSFSMPQDWKPMMGVSQWTIGEKSMLFETTTSDPALFVTEDKLPAASFRTLKIRMKTNVAQPDSLQFFWAYENVGYTEKHSVRAEVKPSDDFVNYAIPLTSNPDWQGRLTELRLDPVSTSGVAIEIQSIQLE